MKVSLDDGVTWVEVSNVRIDLGDDPCHTTTLNLTAEGIITDHWARELPEQCLATHCEMWDDFTERTWVES